MTARRNRRETVILQAMEKWATAEAAGPHGSLSWRLMTRDFARWCRARGLDPELIDDTLRTAFFDVLDIDSPEEEELQCMAG